MSSGQLILTVLFGVLLLFVLAAFNRSRRAGENNAIESASEFKVQARRWLATPLVPLASGTLTLHPQEHLFFETPAQIATLKVTRTYGGGYSGASMRVARGLYFRSGGFQGAPHSNSGMVAGDKGTLYITDQRIIFVGPTKSYDIPGAKLISVEPLRDGLEVHRSNSSPLMFRTGDRHAYVTYLRIREKRLGALSVAEIDALFAPDQDPIRPPRS